MLRFINLLFTQTPERQAESFMAEGLDFFEKKQYPSAIVCLQAAAKLTPKRMNKASAYYHMGLACYENGDLDEAITAFIDGLKAAPNHANIHYQLGVIFLQQQYYQLAHFHLNEAVQHGSSEIDFRTPPPVSFAHK